MRKERAPWPECYYEETDPLKRRALLEEAIEKGEGEPPSMRCAKSSGHCATAKGREKTPRPPTAMWRCG